MPLHLRNALASVLAVGLAGVAAAEPREYVVDGGASRILVHVGKSGVFGFAGHEHEVQALRLGGTIRADEASLAASNVSLEVEAAGLSVTGKGEPAGDVAQVQKKMEGAEVLDAQAFPTIGFKSSSVAGKKAADNAWQLTITGTLTLHGVSRPLSLPVRVERAGDTLTATGRLELRQTDFGMRPVSAGGGTVKVKDELAIEYTIVAKPKL
jgi:polyisoprenoid-binding protein YceI